MKHGNSGSFQRLHLYLFDFIKIGHAIMSLIKNRVLGYFEKLILYATLAVISVSAIPDALAYQAHYFVVTEAVGGSLTVDSHQFVEINGMPESSPFTTKTNILESNLSAAMVEKSSGNIIFETIEKTSPWLRGEFHGGSTIDGHILALADSKYVIRIPVIKGSILRISGNRSPAVALQTAVGAAAVPPVSLLEVDLDAYLLDRADTQMPLPPGTQIGNVYDTGSPVNRLDLLVVAEGYTANQQSIFIQQATALANNFLSISPYRDFKQLINVKWMFVPSNQSGADKPSCPETPGQPIVAVDTAFDATFCTSGIRRLVTVNIGKLLTAAAAIPDWDKIMVLVNDSEYGGAGGSQTVATNHSLSAEIMQHEFGHSFSLLADEYESAYPGYPSCSDLTSERPCPVNVTDQTLRSNLKWARWVDATTPVPTIGPVANPLAAGLWMGARYQSTGMYRQCYNGRMRSMSAPFCYVDSEAFVVRLYSGGWGVPVNGVNLIEPNAVPMSTALNALIRTDVSFQASLAGSLSPGGLTATWFVDNKAASVVTGAHGAQVNFNYTVTDTGSHTIELRATDKTTFVSVAPVSTRSWTVQGLPNVPDVPRIDSVTAGRGSLTVSFTKPSSDGGSLIDSYTVSCAATGQMTRSRSASKSPITVSGLRGNVPYTCSVTATNSQGSSVSAVALPVEPQKGGDITPILMLLLD